MLLFKLAAKKAIVPAVSKVYLGKSYYRKAKIPDKKEPKKKKDTIDSSYWVQVILFCQTIQEEAPIQSRSIPN